MAKAEWTNEELYNFIVKAGENTYAGGGDYIKYPERAGHKELEYSEDSFNYRDSYTGYTQSRGSEYVKYKNKIVWENGYGGGMIPGKEKLADDCFNFLKKAMLKKDKTFQSFRGPKSLRIDDWEYKYHQVGNVESYTGREEIYFQNELVFYHEVAGGIVKS